MAKRGPDQDVDKAISIALRQRPDLGLTSSFQQINPDTVADNSQFHTIDGPHWQVIFGRRGAGKTTLLATHARYITGETNPEASIEINIPDFIPRFDMTKDGRPADQVISQVYFSHFMRYIAEHLFKVFADNNANSKFYRLFRTSSKARYVENLISQIHDSTEIPASVLQSAEMVTTEVDSFSGSEETGREFSIDGEIGAELGKEPTAKGGIKAGGRDARSRVIKKNRDKTTSVQHYTFQYQKTRKLIEDLLEALGLQRLYIFIDEWSELDSSASTGVQPHFADFIRAVFWRNPRFTIKIGAIRNQTRLEMTDEVAGRLVGLEFSGDFVQVNLDSVYSGREFNRVAFFEEMIFRQLSFCNPALLRFQKVGQYEFYGSMYRLPTESFVRHIFKNRQVLASLVDAVGGLPRDFIVCFDLLAKRRRYSVQPPWTLSDVRHAVRDNYLLNKQPGLERNASAVALIERIMARVRANSSRLVLFPKEGDVALLRTVADLYHRRLLHDVDPGSVPGLLRNRYSFYLVDRGLLYDTVQELLTRGDMEQAVPFTSDTDLESVLGYVVSAA